MNTLAICLLAVTVVVSGSPMGSYDSQMSISNNYPQQQTQQNTVTYPQAQLFRGSFSGE